MLVVLVVAAIAVSVVGAGGQSFIFNSIIAVVVGGVLLTGGYGSVVGVVMGTITFAIVNQGIYFTAFDANLASLIIGVLIDFVSWHTAMLIIGALALIAATVFWKILPESRNFRSRSLHPRSLLDGFTKRYRCTRLVWFQRFAWVTEAIRREKQIKEWKRDWKLRLIEETNPDWLDLAADWFPENDPNWVPPQEPD